MNFAGPFGPMVAGLLVWSGLCAAAQEMPLPRTAPRQVKLIYQREASASQCPAAPRELKDEVGARLGYDPFSDSTDRTITVRVERRSGVFIGWLALTEPGLEGAREQRLESRSADCHALTAAMSVAISLAIAPLDPSAHSGLPSPPPLPPPVAIEEEEPKPPPAAAAEATPTPPAASKDGPELTAAAGGEIAFGRAPTVAGGFLLAFEARWPSFSLGLEANALLPTGESVSGGSIETSLIEGMFFPCFRTGVLGLCGLLTAGAQTAKGSGFVGSTSSTAALLDLGGRLLFEFPLFQSVQLWLFADVLAPVIQASVQVSSTEVWRSPAVSLSLGAVLGVTIP